MSERQSFTVASVEDAKKALDYFNGFHDGFMKRIIITSQNDMDMDEDRSENYAARTGVIFDVQIDFAHYNYGYDPSKSYERSPLRPCNQIVHVEFHDVQGLFCDFSEGFLGNDIVELRIHPANRRHGGGSAAQQCLALYLSRHYHLAGYQRTELRESQFFTFTEATFR